MIRKVYRIDKAGSLDNLKLKEENLPELAENHLRIEVQSIGLNFADIFAITGLYSATPKESFIPGLEFSGIVYSVGKKISKYKIGDRVIGVTRFGAYTNYLDINPNYIQYLPKNWSFEEGASIIAGGVTAYYALLPLGNLKAGQTVLIHSAAGGVGLLANRIAKKLGAYTIGVCGNQSKIYYLKKENFDSYFVRDENFKDKLKEKLVGRELNLVLECIGGKIFEESFEALSETGRLVSYGSANFTPKGNSPNFLKLAYNYLTRPKLDPLNMISENKSVLCFNLIWLWNKTEEMNFYLNELLNLEIQPPLIGKKFQFKEMKEALAFFKSGNSVGKVVVNLE